MSRYREIAHLAALLLICSVAAFAQNDPFTQAAQGVSLSVIAVAKYVGIILCVLCGIGLMTGEHHSTAKVAGLLVGLIFALFATPIVTWVQSL